MSALPPKADIGTQPRDVRFVPKADIEELGAYKKSGEPRGNRDSSRPLQNCPKSVMHWPGGFLNINIHSSAQSLNEPLPPPNVTTLRKARPLHQG